MTDTLLITEQQWDKNTCPTVSIICNTYNHQSFITDALEGFLMQRTTFPVEILIHDDASTDGTVEIIKDYHEKHPALIFPIFQKENQYEKGISVGQINRSRSRGRYIAFCEGDDYWTDPLKLQKQVDFLEGHPEYSVCVGGFVRLYQSTKQKISRTKRIKPNDNGLNGYTFTLNDKRCLDLMQPLTSLQKNSIQDVEFSAYRYRRDTHVFYHLLKKGPGFYMLEHLGVHRVHPGGVNSMIDESVRIRKSYLIYKELYVVNRDEFTRRKYLFGIAKMLNNRIYKRNDPVISPAILTLVQEVMPLFRKPGDVRFFSAALFPEFIKRKIRRLVSL